jgi:hypothetical protein
LWWFEEDNSYIGQEILIKNHNAVVGGATKALKVTSDMALGIYNVAKSVHERQTEIAEAVIMGDVAKLNEIGGHYALMLEMGWTIMGEMSEVYNGLPPYERGEIEGRVFFEIATIVIPQTKAVQALKLTKAQTTLKIAESIRKSKWLSTCRPATKAKVEEALTRACIIANHLLDMCFVAGTPIQVDGGWKPIEAIAVGDSVYSSNPIDGTSGYKRVLNVVVTHPSTLYHITYRGTETECELVCTGPHPFWVSNKSCFIPADRLSVGDHLLIADGASAVVSGITVEDAAEGTAFTTYNFEVEEFHTYYAGEVPVLVHNKSPRPCEMIFEMMLEIEKTNPSFDPHTQFQAAILHLVKEGKLNPEDEFIEAMLLKLRKKFYDGKLIEPTSLPYHEGQKAGSSVEGLNWHHWWPTEYLTEEEIAEGVIKHFGPTFELATPSLHTKRPNGIHIKMRRFIADSLGAATVKEGKALFRELPFEEQYEILKQFYKGQGYQMPTFISAGKSR